MKRKGSIGFWIKPIVGQKTETRIDDTQIYVSITPDSRLSVKFVYLLAKESFEHPMPEIGPKGIHIELTWTPQAFRLFLNGKPVETRLRI